MLLSTSVYSQEARNPTLNNAFIGGEPAFFRHILMNIDYPLEARTSGVMGLTEFSFKINCDANPYDFIFTTKLGFGIEEEIRDTIMKTKENWKDCNERNSEDSITLKIAFSINDKFDHEEADLVVNASFGGRR